VTTAHDVAAYVLQQLGPMRAMKLQKIVFYGQAWHLAWSGTPLFDEPIEAWQGGPIIRALWNRHKGRDVLRKWNGHPERLSHAQRRTIARVHSFYGSLTGDELSALTHTEKPWLDARKGLSANQPGRHEITQLAMQEFYTRASTLIDSDDLQTMLCNLVRKLPNGSWGINSAHPQPLYIGHAARLIAPIVAREATS
jgi:uncharacterized phage-associated protein